MICKNCNAEIDENAEYCPVCNVYINSAQMVTREIKMKQTYLLVLDSGAKFNIMPENGTHITVGRTDLATHPDIDLGPYDDGPYISRHHGEFFEEDGQLYYLSTGKNGTKINDQKCGDEPIKISSGDEMMFDSVHGRIVTSEEF